MNKRAYFFVAGVCMSVSPNWYIEYFFWGPTATWLLGVWPLCLHLSTVIHKFVVISDSFVAFGWFGNSTSLSFVGWYISTNIWIKNACFSFFNSSRSYCKFHRIARRIYLVYSKNKPARIYLSIFYWQVPHQTSVHSFGSILIFFIIDN